MTAFIGIDRQGKYELTLLFGKKALSKYARGLNITECLPNPNEKDWLQIDIEKKIITVQLE